MNTAMQELIEMLNESVKQFSNNAQQEAIFFAVIEEAKKQLPKERDQIIDAHIAGQKFASDNNNPDSEEYFTQTYTN